MPVSRCIPFPMREKDPSAKPKSRASAPSRKLRSAQACLPCRGPSAGVREPLRSRILEAADRSPIVRTARFVTCALAFEGVAFKSRHRESIFHKWH